MEKVIFCSQSNQFSYDQSFSCHQQGKTLKWVGHKENKVTKGFLLKKK